jgi:UDP-N-acetylglucosamine diphosphorylase/glucosamine-1-phosphate N-acetyltransferase
MNILLFDDLVLRTQLLPFTFTKPVAEIRLGILRIAEKWGAWLDTEYSYLTQNYLAEKYAARFSGDNLLINGALCPDHSLTQEILALNQGEQLVADGQTLAFRTNKPISLAELSTLDLKLIEYKATFTIIERPWEIFLQNGAQIKVDYQQLTKGRTSAPITDQHTIVYNPEDIFLEEGASTKAAILNAENGPIYLGKNSSIEEGAVIRGPFAIGEDSTVNANARMRGDITIGPHCKVGGEVSNSVLFGYSNKGHEGFLGNSVLGEWCNIGADTNISNLKNNYAKVKVWDFAKNGFTDTGQQFCGMMMGDHSKTGINTMLNTGTVIGVAANIFGSGFPRTFIPSFSWGGAAGFTTFRMNKVNEMAEVSMSRRGGAYDDVEERILQHIYEQTAAYRVWEKPTKS